MGMLSRGAFTLGFVVVAACSDYGAITLQSAPDGGFDSLRPRNVGEKCDAEAKCRTGLDCKDGTCQPGRNLDAGAVCKISAECKSGLYCGTDGKCVAGGTRKDGDTCASEAECSTGLRCNAIGLSAECRAEGTTDVGAACALDKDCFGGLLCIGKVCAAPPSTFTVPPVAINPWQGVTCVKEAGPAKGYFRVPRGADDGDFFRLPFPNDVRRKNGKLDLSGFPSPGADVLGFDLVDRYRQYVEATADGFSAASTVVLRFTAPIDLETLKIDGSVAFYDLTTNTDVAFGFAATNGRSKYVCENALFLRPAPGAPLTPEHTYAAYVTSSVKAPGGGAIAAADDLKALLSDTDPGGALAGAWAAYAPFRAWSKTANVNLGSVVNATVFTVGKHRDPIAKLGAATTTPPAASGWIKCGAGTSPCADVTGTRACGAADATFDELHALVTLPVYQKGKAPFDEEGDVELEASGAPRAQATEQVCASLTIPKGAPMPGDGWPVVVYAHDAGGSFRSSIEDGFAKRFASADAGAARVAVLSYDQPNHGPRRGASKARPEALWFGTANPGAWRGRNVQAAADVMAMAKLASTLNLDAASSPTGSGIDLGTIVLVGHGIGGNAVAMAGPHVDAGGMAIAGIGASFVDTVMSKEQPADFKDVAPVVLGEAPLVNSNVVLTLLQGAFDTVDPLHHAALATNATNAKDVFALYGQNDKHTPGTTQVAYTVAAGLGIVANAAVTAPDTIGKPILGAPAGGNLDNGKTGIVRQYQALAYDGHFVIARDVDAIRDLDRFVADVARKQTPMIGR